MKSRAVEERQMRICMRTDEDMHEDWEWCAGDEDSESEDAIKLKMAESQAPLAKRKVALQPSSTSTDRHRGS